MSSSTYNLVHRIENFDHEVLALDISPSGESLGVGTRTSFEVYSLYTYEQQCKFTKPYRGMISQIRFCTRSEDLNDTVVYTTGLGYFVIVLGSPDLTDWLAGTKEMADTLWTEQSAYCILGGHEITGLVVDLSNEHFIRMALGARDGGIQVLTISNQFEITFGWRITMDETVPIGLSFVDNASKDVMVFGFGDGSITTLRGDDGKYVKDPILCGGPIGSVAMSPSGELFLAHSMTSGVSLHRTEDGLQRRSYWDGAKGRMVIKDVAFAEQSKAIVTGGDEGDAYVFDRTSARRTATLCHQPLGGLVQIIAVHDNAFDGATTIATGASAQVMAGSVCIWRKGTAAPTTTKRTRPLKRIIKSAGVGMVGGLVVLIGAFVFAFIRNLKPDLIILSLKLWVQFYFAR